MKKHTITALTAAFCLLCTGLSAPCITSNTPVVSAADEELTYGNFTYTIENDSITITKCEKTAEKVEVPSTIDGLPVTKIGATAFYNMATLTEVILPEGITSIGSGAFWHDKNLSSVVLPSTLTTIENYAFNDCQALENIDIPASVTEIGNAVFTDTAWIANQKEKSPFVIVNGILIDATKVVEDALAEITAEKERIEKEAEDAKIWKRAGILTNQIGYFPNLMKKATLLTEEETATEFQLLDESGNVVYAGVSIPFGLDEESGDTVQILDFSNFTTEGTYYLKATNGAESRVFKIGINEIYSGLVYDALNYFYQSRSGIDIESQYITSGNTEELARSAGHVSDVATIQNIWGYDGSSGKQDVTGGWYDAGDHGKYVVNGGISLWMLQNLYERALLHGTGNAYQDGTMQLPENANDRADLLDEARYEMEWMLKMIVQDGDYQGMVYHKVHDAKWTSLALSPADDKQPRYLMPPSTAATLNLAACGAQTYRLWKDTDPEFAEACLTASKNAYEAAKKHPDMYAPFTEYGGGGAYGDDDVTDEFYWAACELYIATGDNIYHEDMQNSAWNLAIPSTLNGGEADGINGSFDWGNTASLGSLSLLLNESQLSVEENDTLRQNLTTTADKYVQLENEQGYGLPYHGNQGNYVWASNSFVADNAIILAYANDINPNADYLNGVVGAMDYLLGRNPMDYSYVTGYGIHSVQYPHHRFWAKSLDSSFPKAPCGVLVGGANTGMEDSVVKLTTWAKDGTAPQKYYVDDIEAYSVNECTINWNSPLAWVTSYLCEQNGGIIVSQTSLGTQLPEYEPAELPSIENTPIVIHIPDGVTVIGTQIFGKSKDYVSEVVLPDGVKIISKEAFYQCQKLENVIIPDSIEQVGDSAFAKTPWLTNMLSESPMLIMNHLLIDGSATKGEITIPDDVTAILGGAFENNTAITSVNFPEGVERIGKNAFKGCSALETVQLPESLKTIEQGAFSGTGLTSLTIPASVTKIADEAFINCKSLPEVTMKTTNATIGNEAFGWTSTFTSTGQYSYIFIHLPIDNFVVHCYEGSTADIYATNSQLNAVYMEESKILGDVNCNGSVDIIDVLTLNRYLLALTSVGEQGRTNADVNLDGNIADDDAMNILKSLVNLVTLPVK